MNEIIYLESDDDIASVIGRIKEIEADGVSLMVPRGGTIGQSIVNLKLLKREIEKQNKIISLITADKISRNLAAQVGITIYPSVAEARNAKPVNMKPVTFEDSNEDAAGDEIIEPATPEELEASGFTVNRYDENAKNKADEAPFINEKPEIEQKPVPEFVSETEEDEIIEPAKATKETSEDKPPEMIITSNSGTGNFEERPKMQSDFKPKKIGSRKKPLLIIIGAFLVLAIILTYVFLPYTTAAISLSSTDYEKSYEFTIDKNLKDPNVVDLILPGTEQSTQGDLSKEFNSTGTKDEGTKAAGNINFYNQFDTNPQTIPDGSLLSASGKQFLSVGAVTIPGATVSGGNIVAGQIAGKIIAKEAGDSYNLTPAKFTIESFSGEKRMKIFGQTAAALTGGTTKTIKIISTDDIKKATDSLTTDLTTQLSDQIQTEVGKDSGKFLASTAVSEQVALTNTNKEGDTADKFTVKLTLKVKGISFSETALKQLLSEKVGKEITDSQMIINQQNTIVTYEVISYDKDKGQVKMSSKFNTKIGQKINSDEIKNNLKYKKYGTARGYILGIDGVKDVDLKVWPSFLARTPLVKSRIKITFGYAE